MNSMFCNCTSTPLQSRMTDCCHLSSCLKGKPCGARAGSMWMSPRARSAASSPRPELSAAGYSSVSGYHQPPAYDRRPPAKALSHSAVNQLDGDEPYYYLPRGGLANSETNLATSAQRYGAGDARGYYPAAAAATGSTYYHTAARAPRLSRRARSVEHEPEQYYDPYRQQIYERDAERLRDEQQDTRYGVQTFREAPQFSRSRSGGAVDERLCEFGGGSLILDLQNQITELTRECSLLRQELDSLREKLSSTMNSIKTFWSPELKKERALRKEEAAKLAMLSEQYKLIQIENQKRLLKIQELEQRLTAYEETSSRHQSPHRVVPDDTARQERDRLQRELSLSRKTVEELEERLSRQREALGQRDDNIQRLLDMVNAKKPESKGVTGDVEKLQTRLLESYTKIRTLEGQLSDRTGELLKLQEETKGLARSGSGFTAEQNTAFNQMLELKEQRIRTLEADLREMEAELRSLRAGDRSGDHRQLEMLRGQEKVVKAKADSLKIELSNKEADISGLRSKIATLEAQISDQQQHIGVLREQIQAKESQANILQTDFVNLETRVRTRETELDTKCRALTQLQTERKRLDHELHELRDHIDIKEKKINVLQKKGDNLEEILRDKDAQISLLKSRLSAIHGDQAQSDSSISHLQQKLADRERQVEKLKDQLSHIDSSYRGELGSAQSVNNDLKKRLESIQFELESSQSSLARCREEAAALRDTSEQQERRCLDLDRQLTQKSADVSDIQGQLEKTRNRQSAESSQRICELESRLEELSQKAASDAEKVTASRTAADDLRKKVTELEAAAREKDRAVEDLSRQLDETASELVSRRTSAGEGESAALEHLREEMRRRESSASSDNKLLKRQLEERDARIGELETALRESVNIAAEREISVQQQKMTAAGQPQGAGEQYSSLCDELDRLKRGRLDLEAEVHRLHGELEERENQLKHLLLERGQHMGELLEIKQEALVAAMCEKDANIALLELSTMGHNNPATDKQTQRLYQEKQELQIQLRALAERRAMLMEENSELSQSPAESEQHHQQQRSQLRH